MKLSTIGAGAALAALALLTPSCASKGPGAPIFFGRTPMGDVDERPIEPVSIHDSGPTNNFSGRKTDAGLKYDGMDVPDRWPVDNEHEVLSRFGPRGRRGKLHAGFDIRAAMRSPVYACADGLVVAYENGGAYGKVIVIDHGGGYETAYAHLDERIADVGDVVKAGDKIALSGRSGNATTPHVHYEVRKNGRPISPGPYLPGS